jgi:hypothetical protein
LDLGGTSVCNSNNEIIALVKESPNLVSLGSYCFSDEVILNLCSSIGEDHPLSVIVGDGRITELTDDGLSLLSTPLSGDFLVDFFIPENFIGIPQLSTLRIYSCQKITDSGLIYLAGGNPSKIFDTSELSDRDHHGCKFLTQVSFFHCQNITDDGIQILLRGCRFIRELELIGCERIGEPDSRGEFESQIGTSLATCLSLRYINLVGTSVDTRQVGILLSQLKHVAREERKALAKDYSLELCLERERFEGYVRFRNSEMSMPDFVTISYLTYNGRDFIGINKP